MVNRLEMRARMHDFFSFSRDELIGLFFSIIIVGFIFSFRDWGTESFSFSSGLGHLLQACLVAIITFFGRVSFQKIIALSWGYKAEFRVWWTGIIISVVIAFISLGRLPLVLIGGIVTTFMVRQRLGEYRYGYSFHQNALISFFGIVANLILALFFALGLYYFPKNYFLTKGLWMNLVMSLCSLLPLTQNEGLGIFFGSRSFYFLSVVMVLIIGLLLISMTKLGLIISIIIGVLGLIFYLLTYSEI